MTGINPNYDLNAQLVNGQTGITNNPQNSGKPYEPILQVGDGTQPVSENGTYPTEPKEMVEFALQKADLGYSPDSNEYKLLEYEMRNKLGVMMLVAERTGVKLTPEVAHLRLVNFAKGWKFNQFEQKAAFGLQTEDWKYGEDVQDKTDAEALEILKNHYSQMADEYVELYDGDGNGSIDLLEMFSRELEEHYVSQGLSIQDAKKKALDKTVEFSQKSFAEIDASTESTDEMSLYKMLMTKFGTMQMASDEQMNINTIRTFSKDEVQAFLFTKANYDASGRNDMTPDESRNLEMDIQTGDPNVNNWLVAARKFLGL